MRRFQVDLLAMTVIEWCVWFVWVRDHSDGRLVNIESNFRTVGVILRLIFSSIPFRPLPSCGILCMMTACG